MLWTSRAWLLLAAGQVLPGLGKLLGKQPEQNLSAAPHVSGQNFICLGGPLGVAECSGSGLSLCGRRLCCGLAQALLGGERGCFFWGRVGAFV